MHMILYIVALDIINVVKRSRLLFIIIYFYFQVKDLYMVGMRHDDVVVIFG